MESNRLKRRWLRRVLIGAALVLIPSFSAYFAYQSQSFNLIDQMPAEQIVSPAPVLAQRPVTLAPGLHLLGGLAPAAAYVVETSAGLVLIDSGLEPDAHQLKKEMAALQLDWHSIHAILITHSHGDHCGGAEYLRRTTGARVYAGAGDAAILRAGGPREAFYSVFYVPDGLRPAATLVDVELHGDETLEFGDTRIRTIATPGHTPGSICYLLDVGGDSALFSGDVIMSLDDAPESASPFERRLGTYAAYLAPSYRGDAHAFARTLRTLRAMPAPQIVLPGHPRNSPVPTSPAMTQARWEWILDSGIREMDHLLYRQARDGSNFLDGEPKKLLPNLYYFGDFEENAVYGFIADSQLFVVTSPGGVGLNKFLAPRIAQLEIDPGMPTMILLTSITPEKRAALEDLFQNFRGNVVLPADAQKALAKICNPKTKPILAEKIAGRIGVAVCELPMEIEDSFSVAYQVKLNEKSIVFTDLVPLKPVHGATSRFSSAIRRFRTHAFRIRGFLDQLRECKPAFWLPATATDRQSANLDFEEWTHILDWNDELLK